MEKQKVIVTGASGFIGRHCLTPLAALGYEVHAISSSEVTLNYPGILWHRCNLLNGTEVHQLTEAVQASHLLHLAWYTEHGAFWESKNNPLWLSAGINLTNCFCRAGGRRIVMAGSGAEYDQKAGACDEESTPCSPATLYGASKHALHVIASKMADRYGTSMAWGRIFNLFGPCEDSRRLVPAVIHSLLGGKNFELKHPAAARDLLYVTDVADAFVALTDSELSGAVNICSGVPVILSDLTGMIAADLGLPDTILRAGQINENDQSLYGIKGKLFSELAWTPKTTLQNAINSTINFWRDKMSRR